MSSVPCCWADSNTGNSATSTRLYSVLAVDEPGTHSLRAVPNIASWLGCEQPGMGTPQWQTSREEEKRRRKCGNTCAAEKGPAHPSRYGTARERPCFVCTRALRAEATVQDVSRAAKQQSCQTLLSEPRGETSPGRSCGLANVILWRTREKKRNSREGSLRETCCRCMWATQLALHCTELQYLEQASISDRRDRLVLHSMQSITYPCSALQLAAPSTVKKKRSNRPVIFV
ncbi:hypothetical protein J3F84DRAFT_366875 [Trichoderma pleuroticola]